jgi:3-isopropylmalate dehydratase small subunit
MLKDKMRKEVTLDKETISLLQIQAEKEGRKLKNYMEHILRNKANEFELTNEYKKMMNNLLDKNENGELNFISEKDFRRKTAR